MIQYEAICKTGLIRKNNEDNIYLNGFHLPIIHNDFHTNGENSSGLYAVFDGMGGEDRGEAASFLAAETLKKEAENLDEVCQKMSDVIVDFSKRSKLKFCGSTAAMVKIEGKRAVCINVGDSRIFHIRDEEIRQISRDDIKIIAGRKYLSQCLGVPKEEFFLSPNVAEIEIKRGDKIFICSDGITDLISEEEIVKNTALPYIEKMVIERGAFDNYSGIMLRM